MKIKLKDFQEKHVDCLIQHLRMASNETGTSQQAVVFSSPTGSGKTIMATAAIEKLLSGDSHYSFSTNATFLWLSDQPEINEQTRRKMLGTSSLLGMKQLVVVNSSFDQEFFLPGKVYFLNTQKLGKEKQLVMYGDRRTFTIWDTLANTIQKQPENFFVFIDEAHRGMAVSPSEQKEAISIIQKFIIGSEKIPPVPIIVGISATPERFDVLIGSTERVRRRVSVPSDAIRESGLLKDTIRLFYPDANRPTDFTMLQAATKSWKEFDEYWKTYCKEQNEKDIQPILLVQVEDGGSEKISNTDIV